jgi:hypothetical protein
MNNARPVRSRPDLVIPPCPTCAGDVEYTLTYEARAAVPASIAAAYTDRAPEPDDPHRLIVWVGETPLDGYRIVGGAPDVDMVEARPCGCVQHGAAAHRYLLAAVNATHPHLRFAVTVEIPAELLGESSPRIFTVSSSTGTADVAASTSVTPFADRLRALVAIALETLPDRPDATGPKPREAIR